MVSSRVTWKKKKTIFVLCDRPHFWCKPVYGVSWLDSIGEIKPGAFRQCVTIDRSRYWGGFCLHMIKLLGLKLKINQFQVVKLVPPPPIPRCRPYIAYYCTHIYSVPTHTNASIAIAVAAPSFAYILKLFYFIFSSAAHLLCILTPTSAITIATTFVQEIFLLIFLWD